MATGIGFTFAAVVIVAMIALAIALFIALVVRYRGKRIVTCPETHAPVGAKIDVARAAGTWIIGQPHFAITACSRWPDRADCDQACVPQIEASPDETLVRNIVLEWYHDRTCVYCANPIREIGGAAVAPALLALDGSLREWRDIAPEDLPQILASSVAVCARCELAEDFRRRFPDRVIDRPGTITRRRHVIEPASQAVY